MPARRRRAPDIERTDDPIADLGRYWHQLTEEQRAAVVPLLDPADVVVLERGRAIVSREGWRATPLSLGMRLGILEDLPHTRLLSDKFADAVTGRSSFQIWNLPPQHGKSLIGSKVGPAWALDLDPTIKLALTSYGDTLADENAAFVRDTLVEHGDVLRTRLRRDRRRMDRFLTTEGGGLIAAGVGSGLTGFGAHGIVVDDPFKNWEDAHSETQRERVWNWFRAVVLTRQNQRRGIPFFVIVVQTRWHEDDLTGKLLAQAAQGDGYPFELVRLPAICDDVDDLLHRAIGAALAPTLHTAKSLLAAMSAVGSYLAAGLYQQLPAPEAGTDILREWWEISTSIPSKYDDALTSWDMKLKDKETGDFVVGQAWGRTGPDYWCVDSLRGQWNQPTVRAAIALMSVRHPKIRRHVIENTGNGPEVIAQLRKADPGYELSDEIAGKLGMTEDERDKVQKLLRRGMNGIVPENVKGKKTVRMRAYSPLLEGHHVHVPEGATWTGLLIDEASAFPNGAHDDQIDAMSQALKRLSNAPAKARASRKRTSKPPVSTRTRGSGTSGRTRTGATTRTRFRQR